MLSAGLAARRGTAASRRTGTAGVAAWPVAYGSIARTWLFDPDVDATATLDGDGRCGALAEAGGDATRSWTQATTAAKPATARVRGRRVLDFESALSGAATSLLVGSAGLLADWKAPRGPYTLAFVWIAPAAYAGATATDYCRLLGANNVSGAAGGGVSTARHLLALEADAGGYAQAAIEREAGGANGTESANLGAGGLAAGGVYFIAARANADGTADLFVNGTKRARANGRTLAATAAANSSGPANSSTVRANASDAGFAALSRCFVGWGDGGASARVCGRAGAMLRFGGALADADVSNLSAIAAARYP